MGILGRALGRYLSAYKGLYSVELPDSLVGEAVDLVNVCNGVANNRAFYVIKNGQDAGVEAASIDWTELLKWRTDEDRVFTWTRGLHEPDSSFQSVVQPFISSRFPGRPRGLCALGDLVRITIREVWREVDVEIRDDGLAYQSFLDTATWVADVLVHNFRSYGGGLRSHWSSGFLVHWSELLDGVADGLKLVTASGNPVEVWHGWEIVRQAGLPIPGHLDGGDRGLHRGAGNLSARQVVRLSNRWQEIVDEYVVPDEQIGVLLAAISRTLGQDPEGCSWSFLDWDRAANHETGVPAVTVTRSVFTSPPARSPFEVERPSYESPQQGAWWGVTLGDVEDAISLLKEQSTFRWVGDSVFPVGEEGHYTGVLCTRRGRLEHVHDDGAWTTDVHLQEVSFAYQGHWRGVSWAQAEPERPAEGEGVWIRPDDVEIKIRGRGIECKDFRATPSQRNNALHVNMNLRVRYAASRDGETGEFVGRWNPRATLKLRTTVRDWKGDHWAAAGRVEEVSVPLIVPSAFVPTVFVGSEAVAAVPGSSDEFQATDGGAGIWEPSATPDISIKGEGTRELVIYDGEIHTDGARFVGDRQFSFAEESVPDAEDIAAGFSGEFYFRDGDQVTATLASGVSTEIATIRVGEESSTHSCSLTAIIDGNRSSEAEPSRRASDSLLGRAQQGLVGGLCRTSAHAETFTSLFQYVVAANSGVVEWRDHPGGREAAVLIPGAEQTDLLVGLGEGVSRELYETPELNLFAEALNSIRSALQLSHRSGEPRWLSGIDLTQASIELVREYIARHRDLIVAARALNSPGDVFWASYPLSVVIVDGGLGGRGGQLLSVLLSPLHPVRFAWAYGLSKVAKGADRECFGEVLFGLAEGWNFPMVGPGVTSAGEPIDLIAAPLDPGADDDFIGWGALSVLEVSSGLRLLPETAAGLPIPWAGQSGLNDEVVNRSLRDFSRVHPHLTSLEVDLRSFDPSPRSPEVDQAVLEAVAAGEAHWIGGGTRVWDSSNRLGMPPGREEYFARRRDGGRPRTFEWHRYEPGSPSPISDIAFVENPSVNLSLGAAQEALGVLGPIPLRRFAPAEASSGRLRQYYGAGDRDLLGVGELLRVLEADASGKGRWLQSSPTHHGLGLRGGADWEVLGTFNVDPALITGVLARRPDRRIVWEWRPSWLNIKDGDLSKRPYYVVAQVPRSLTTELELRHGIGEDRCLRMLSVLGARGVGLAALSARGGNQASAAAGFYYALQLLDVVGSSGEHSGSKEPRTRQDTASFQVVLPLDPVHTVLNGMLGRTGGKRADLIVAQLVFEEGREPQVLFVPVEVKHRGRKDRTASFPEAEDQQVGNAEAQLEGACDLMREIVVRATSTSNVVQGEGLAEYLSRVGLATLLDLGCGLASESRRVPASLVSQLLTATLDGRVRLGVGEPVLLWFSAGAASVAGTACEVQTTERGSNLIYEVFLDPSAVEGLFWNDAEPGENERSALKRIAEVFRSALAGATAAPPPRDSLCLGDQLSSWMGMAESEGSRGTGEALNQGDPDTGAGEESPERASGVEHESEGSESETANEAEARGVGSEHGPPTPEGKPEVSSEDERHKFNGASSDSVKRTEGEDETGVQDARPFRLVVGSEEVNRRWTILGRLARTDEKVALDLDEPKAMGVFGYMGSGKSYFLGTLIEGATQSIEGLNNLTAPLAVVVFNYRREASDRFELGSLSEANSDEEQVSELRSRYGTEPEGLGDVRVLCLPGELTGDRRSEYGKLEASELYFNPERLSLEDWELLMGEPGKSKVYAQAIRHTLDRLRREEDRITLPSLRENVEERLSGSSLQAAKFRFELVEDYVSHEKGIDFGSVIQPGRVLIIDLRKPLFDKTDALRFFLICARQVSQIQGSFNKLLVFDEAHEYLSDAFGERMESRIRLMRHEGSSYVFATQDVASIPSSVRRFVTTNFVFGLGTNQNAQDMVNFAPEFSEMDLIRRDPGTCLIQANRSTERLFSKPKEVIVRPRVSQHGGASRIHTE